MLPSRARESSAEHPVHGAPFDALFGEAEDLVVVRPQERERCVAWRERREPLGRGCVEPALYDRSLVHLGHERRSAADLRSVSSGVNSRFVTRGTGRGVAIRSRVFRGRRARTARSSASRGAGSRAQRAPVARRRIRRRGPDDHTGARARTRYRRATQAGGRRVRVRRRRSGTRPPGHVRRASRTVRRELRVTSTRCALPARAPRRARCRVTRRSDRHAIRDVHHHGVVLDQHRCAAEHLVVGVRREHRHPARGYLAHIRWIMRAGVPRAGARGRRRTARAPPRRHPGAPGTRRARRRGR